MQSLFKSLINVTNTNVLSVSSILTVIHWGMAYSDSPCSYLCQLPSAGREAAASLHASPTWFTSNSKDRSQLNILTDIQSCIQNYCLIIYVMNCGGHPPNLLVGVWIGLFVHALSHKSRKDSSLPHCVVFYTWLRIAKSVSTNSPQQWHQNCTATAHL